MLFVIVFIRECRNVALYMLVLFYLVDGASASACLSCKLPVVDPPATPGTSSHPSLSVICHLVWRLIRCPVIILFVISIVIYFNLSHSIFHPVVTRLSFCLSSCCYICPSPACPACHPIDHITLLSYLSPVCHTVCHPACKHNFSLSPCLSSFCPVCQLVGHPMQCVIV